MAKVKSKIIESAYIKKQVRKRMLGKQFSKEEKEQLRQKTIHTYNKK